MFITNQKDLKDNILHLSQLKPFLSKILKSEFKLDKEAYFEQIL